MASWVADIGGSSSRWARLVPEGAGGAVEVLPGFNPVSGDPSALVAAMGRLRDDHPGTVRELHIHGAGCGSPEGAGRMYEVMRSAWPGTQVHVGTDLLGAARALHGDHPGLVLVLGTGMSCGHYDGRSIRKAMPSLGWILGDEGSGADLGKRMVTDGLAGRLSKELSQVLFPEGLERGNVLQQVYRSAAPQAYLAAFAKRLAEPGAAAYAEALLADRFTELALSVLAAFPEAASTGVKASGSIAWAFRPLLQAAFGRQGLSLTEVVRDPLPGLLRWHSR
jgi:glucosamine kinase